MCHSLSEVCCVLLLGVCFDWRCLLFVACCMLCEIGCSMLVVQCLSCVACRFACYVLCVVCCLLFVVRCSLCVMCSLCVVACCVLLFVVCYVCLSVGVWPTLLDIYSLLFVLCDVFVVL